MDNRAIVLEGFEFELTGFFSADGTTTISISISGNGQSQTDLKGWICEICPADVQGFSQVNIISCEKRRRQGSWAPAVAQKTAYELTGDIGINGVIITDWIGRYEDDPAVEYRMVFDAELLPEPFRVGFIQGETAHVSKETIRISSKPENKTWLLPIEKSFCLFVAVPEGYKPQSACRASVSASKRLLHIAHCENEDETGKPVRADVLGCVRIVASIPLTSAQACGDEVYAASCDCFDVCETAGFAEEDERFDIREISVCPLPASFDLTLLNLHCGKSVYRLDGKYVIDRK